MGYEASDSAYLRIVLLEDESLVSVHLRKIGPPVVGRFLYEVHLARAIAIAQVREDEVFHGDRARITDRKRRINDLPADRAPDVDDGEAMDLRSDGRFERQVLEALLPRGLAVVAVDSSRGAGAATVTAAPEGQRGGARPLAVGPGDRR